MGRAFLLVKATVTAGCGLKKTQKNGVEFSRLV